MTSEYADHPFWNSGVGSTLKFCNLWALDPEECCYVQDKLLCLKKIDCELFELRHIKKNSECGTKCSYEKALKTIDEWMDKLGHCTYVEWIPRVPFVGNLAGLDEIALLASPHCPTNSLARKRGVGWSDTN